MADNVLKKVVDMRKGKTAILPSIVTNPELTGEEESLKSVGINGTNFTIGGGDGQLKLVATGTYDEETSQSTGSNHSAYFKLNNKLEDNKLYIVTYNNIFDNISITLLGKYYAGSINVTNETEDGVIPLKVYWQEEGSFDYIVFNNDGESVIEVTDINSTFYVYELPLTFNEEPKVDNKMKLVATGTYDSEGSNENITEFKLDNVLEEGKTYLIKYYEDSLGSCNYANLHISSGNNYSVISAVDIDDNRIHCDINYTSSGINASDYIRLIHYNKELAITEDADYIEIYELPYELEI